MCTHFFESGEYLSPRIYRMNIIRDTAIHKTEINFTFSWKISTVALVFIKFRESVRSSDTNTHTHTHTHTHTQNIYTKKENPLERNLFADSDGDIRAKTKSLT